ncbi:MAG: hypothetical protein MR585_08350 [Selenomonas bovis]|nr:hypothetical protein [Selenomonas bovis]
MADSAASGINKNRMAWINTIIAPFASQPIDTLWFPNFYESFYFPAPAEKKEKKKSVTSLSYLYTHKAGNFHIL